LLHPRSRGCTRKRWYRGTILKVREARYDRNKKKEKKKTAPENASAGNGEIRNEGNYRPRTLRPEGDYDNWTGTGGETLRPSCYWGALNLPLHRHEEIFEDQKNVPKPKP